jgi:ABC-type transporter Mla maintaining outer membrane lipid asymmetry ATPase subunit MlaF
MPTHNDESLAVVFDKVSFAFDDHVVLKEISFSVPKASMAILLGASGAGKSIVLKLILGLLRPDSGTIVVLVAGARKADAVRAALDEPLDVQKYPAQLLRSAGDRVEWFVDSAAAAQL